jgi:hypothetical protein
MGKSGIVMVETKKGNVREPLTDRQKIIHGLSKPIEFRHSYSGATGKPDFRALAYWNPTVKTDASGKATFAFSTTDDITSWQVVIEGYSDDGKYFQTTKDIPVSWNGRD